MSSKPTKPSYQDLEQERDDLRVIIANLHKCLSWATVSLRDAGLYPYPGRAKNKEEEEVAEVAWRCWNADAPKKEVERMPKLNAIHQQQLDEDERKDRTEFLPDDLNEKGWIRYQQKQIYFAMLRWGNWRE
jgi:hypothetical protein